MFATSVGGSTTGKGGTTLVIDDPHSVEQAYSDIERESAIRYLRQTLMTRLDDPRTGKIVLPMQRLHENDASGEFLRDGLLPMDATPEALITALIGQNHSSRDFHAIAIEPK